ncbi:MAG: FAD-dependent oxidoreductase [Actinomycetota bacterium]
MPEVYDVVIIGAGVVGAAVARLLSHHQLDVALLDAAPDIGAGTSKANTAILHTGFDATPGSLESRLVARGYALLSDYAPTVGIAIEPIGALLVAWDDEQAASLNASAQKAVANGYRGASLIDAQSVYELEPQLASGARGAMVVPDEFIIDPWSTPLAFAKEAIANGVTWLPNHSVTKLDRSHGITVISTAEQHTLRARCVVNAAGLHSDDVHALFGLAGFTVRPRRGELIVFDKLARSLLSHTILPVPTSHTKGVLVAPTVFGNIMLGPTADDIDDKTATGSTRAGIDSLLAKGQRILPALLHEEVTAVYAGLRAATQHSDYQISHDPALGYVCLGGIRSTGLTASMALAEEALMLLQQCGLSATPKASDELRSIRVTNLGEAFVRPYQSGSSGAIVCHCERTTSNEIVEACTVAPAATTLDGIRRRTRALSGRCQGFYCSAEVCALAANASGTPMSDWLGNQ